MTYFWVFSDEEDDNDQLLFLTITPEFDELDENNANMTEMPVITNAYFFSKHSSNKLKKLF
jgi:hypothetical protein